jgi:hypothetical protein
VGNDAAMTPNLPLVSAELPLHILAARQGGIVTGEQALASGLTPRRIRTLVQRGDWSTPFRGLFHAEGPSADGALPLLARVWAGHLRAGPHSVVGLGSAARLLGLQGLPEAGEQPEPEPAELVLPPGRARRRAPGLNLHYWPLGAEEVTRLGRLPLTDPVRTLADTLLHLPPDGGRARGLSLLDSALHRRLIGPAELPSVERVIRGRPGAVVMTRLLPLADGRAASPLQSRLRLLCLDAGLPPDHLQYRVRDGGGRCRAIVGLAWTTGLARPLFVAADDDGPDRRVQNQLERLTDARLLRYARSDLAEAGGRRVAEEIRATLRACR